MAKIYDGILLLGEILLVILKMFYYICEAVCKLFIPIKKKSVAGEIVLITGAGHGIGKELAFGYASLGATVVCWDINEETNKQTMKEIKEMGRDSVYAYRCDVTDREEVFKVAEKVREEVGDVTILINNAGVALIRKFLDQSVYEITQTIDVNLMAHYWTLRAFLPRMVEKNHGHIVALSSIAGLTAGPHGTIYCPTKFGVKALMEALSEEFRAYGNSAIKFTTVYPALVLTGFCKKPKVRFPRITRALSPKEAASLIIDAQRKNFRNRSLPSHWLPISKILRLLPDSALFCLLDFFNTGVHPDD